MVLRSWLPQGLIRNEERRITNQELVCLVQLRQGAGAVGPRVVASLSAAGYRVWTLSLDGPSGSGAYGSVDVTECGRDLLRQGAMEGRWREPVRGSVETRIGDITDLTASVL